MSERRFRTQVKQNNQVYHDLESAWSVLLASFRLGSYVLVPCNNRYFARKPVFIEFLQIFDKCGLTLLTHIHLMILKILTWQNGLVYSLGCASTHGNKPIFPFLSQRTLSRGCGTRKLKLTCRSTVLRGVVRRCVRFFLRDQRSRLQRAIWSVILPKQARKPAARPTRMSALQ